LLFFITLVLGLDGAGQQPIGPAAADPIPAFVGGQVPGDLRQTIGWAIAWLLRTLPHSRKVYQADLAQAGIAPSAWEQLA
jgi:hypothetical protein